MGELKLRILGPFAPEGSPERDYFRASLGIGDFSAAQRRLANEGCPTFMADEIATWDGEKWNVEKRLSEMRGNGEGYAE